MILLSKLRAPLFDEALQGEDVHVHRTLQEGPRGEQRSHLRGYRRRLVGDEVRVVIVSVVGWVAPREKLHHPAVYHDRDAHTSLRGDASGVVAVVNGLLRIPQMLQLLGLLRRLRKLRHFWSPRKSPHQ